VEGEGPLHADIMLVGQNPEKKEMTEKEIDTLFTSMQRIFEVGGPWGCRIPGRSRHLFPRPGCAWFFLSTAGKGCSALVLFQFLAAQCLYRQGNHVIIYTDINFKRFRDRIHKQCIDHIRVNLCIGFLNHRGHFNAVDQSRCRICRIFVRRAMSLFRKKVEKARYYGLVVGPGPVWASVRSGTDNHDCTYPKGSGCKVVKASFSV
jgi:hypothetical protein